MTEAEWLACSHQDVMLRYLRRYRPRKASDRKLRLFACACCRRTWSLLTDERSRAAVEAAERFADGQIDVSSLEAAAAAARQANSALWEANVQSGYQLQFASAAATAVCHLTQPDLRPVLASIGMNCASAICAAQGQTRAEEIRPLEEQKQAAIVRDLFANPFRRLPFVRSDTRAWNDSTIPKIAQAIYDEPAFDRLPVLADALEDAGCDDADILKHCRGEGPHLRGCWVVDLLLGKQ
jgi:hypothetical protein